MATGLGAIFANYNLNWHPYVGTLLMRKHLPHSVRRSSGSLIAKQLAQLQHLTIRRGIVSDHIRELRMRHQLRQRDVARQIGISDYQIRKWERGLELPPPRIIHAMAAFFGVLPGELERSQISFMERAAPGEGYTTAQPSFSRVEQATAPALPEKLRVLDLFCGAGGLSFGLEMTERFTTVAGLDLLPDRIATFRANHPHATGIAGDIRDISPNDFMDIVNGIDVIVGGPPCQGFSSIRPFRTLTLGDKRNTLIEQFVAWVTVIRPRWFIFENVLGLLTHHRGVILQTLLNGFMTNGYRISWCVINAAHYGVPQNRERLVVVGHRTNSEFQWPLPSHRTEYKSMAGTRPEVAQSQPMIADFRAKAITLIEAIGDLPAIEAGQSARNYNAAPQNDYQNWVRNGEDTLTMHQATNHSKHMLKILQHAGPNISSIPEHLISSGFSSSYSRLDADRPSTTLTVNFVHPASNRCIHPFQNRALTPREGARIQSFPDSFTFRGTRAQIVKQIGNAVPPLLAMTIGEAIAKADGSDSAVHENVPLARRYCYAPQLTENRFFH